MGGPRTRKSTTGEMDENNEENQGSLDSTMTSMEKDTSTISLQAIADLLKEVEGRINNKIQEEIENIDRREAESETLYFEKIQQMETEMDRLSQ